MDLRGVILAAGQGSRMNRLNSTYPKPLLPEPERCLLRQQIQFLTPYVDSLYVTVGHKSEQVLHFLKDFPQVRPLDTSNQSNAAFLRSTDFLDWEGHSLVLTCDNPIDRDLETVIREATNDWPVSYLVAVDSTRIQPPPHGDRIILNGNKVDLMGPDLSSNLLASGLQILAINNFSRNSEEENFQMVWNRLIDRDLLKVSGVMPRSWFAVDTPEQLEAWEVAR